MRGRGERDRERHTHTHTDRHRKQREIGEREGCEKQRERSVCPNLFNK